MVSSIVSFVLIELVVQIIPIKIHILNKWYQSKVVFLARLLMEANTSTMVVLNGTNYQKWKGKMKDLLFVKNLHLPVFASDKPQKKSVEEWSFENQQVCGFIRQWVGDNVLNHVVNETNAKTLWNKLETVYASEPVTISCFYLNKQCI